MSEQTCKIDLSPEALQKCREIAEKATPGPWKPGELCEVDFEFAEDVVKGVSVDIAPALFVAGANNIAANVTHIAASSPDAIIAMIGEIERLRDENLKLNGRMTVGMLPSYVHRKVLSLEKEANWLANQLSNACPKNKPDCSLGQGRIHNCAACWRQAAKQAVED